MVYSKKSHLEMDDLEVLYPHFSGPSYVSRVIPIEFVEKKVD